MAELFGTTGSETIKGTPESDTIDFSQGGSDTVNALNGDDTILAGNSLDSGDRIDGGDGFDLLFIGSSGVLTATLTSQSVEVVNISGSVDLTISGATAGLTGEIFANYCDFLRVDASAVSYSIPFAIFWDCNEVELIGGSGADRFYVEASGPVTMICGGGDDSFDSNIEPFFDPTEDVLDGGEGYETVSFFEAPLWGGEVSLAGAHFRNIDEFNLGGPNEALTVDDGVVSAGNVMKINSFAAGNWTFDGSAELDGRFEIYATGGDDALTGSLGDDILSGGAGIDTVFFAGARSAYTVSDVVGGEVIVSGPTGTDIVRDVEFFSFAGAVFPVDGLDALTVGDAGIYASINDPANLPRAMDDAVAGDTIALVGDYSNETALVTIDGLTVTGDAASTNIGLLLGTGVRNITLDGAAAIDVTGNAFGNTITGNGGNNVIDGDTGADKMAGRGGDDAYVVDASGDIVTEASGNGTDTVRSSITYTLLANLENLVLTGSAALAGTGNSLSNALTGNSGNNSLAGNEGNDAIDGGTGADSMEGGAGDDLFVVDSAGDTVEGGSGIDTVRSSVMFVLNTTVENLVLTGSDAIDGTGNHGNNSMTGNTAANTLNGSGGVDAAAGGAGDDTYYADQSGDAAIELAGEGYDTVRSTVSFTLGVELERLVLRGTVDIDGKGNDLDNDIWGNAGVNRLEGGLGNDRVNGGAGIDRLIGGDGDDVFVTDTARDVVVEFAGEGIDRIESLVSKALVANVENLALRGTARINGFGNELANAISGNAQANYVDGREGADTLTGGAGRDSFAFTTALGASNIDTIIDFRVVDDTIRLDDAIFANLGGLRWLAADAFHTGASAGDTSDRIIYNSATGALFYDADGLGGAAQAKFASLAVGVAMSNMDFFVA